MARTHQGRVPDSADGWVQQEVLQSDGVEWGVYVQPQEHTPDWITVKVVAHGRAPNKANYWMVRNKKSGKTGFAKDFMAMMVNRPELYKMVEDVLNGVE